MRAEASRILLPDDIEVVFSTGDNNVTSTAQRAVEMEASRRWAAFVATGSPNVIGSGTASDGSTTTTTDGSYTLWNPVTVSTHQPAPYSGISNFAATTVQLNLLKLNGSGSTVSQTQNPAACGPGGLWGRKALFDAQIFT